MRRCDRNVFIFDKIWILKYIWNDKYPQATIKRVWGQWKMTRRWVNCSSGLLALRKDFSMFGDLEVYCSRKIHQSKYFSAWNLQVQTFILLCESGGSGKKRTALCGCNNWIYLDRCGCRHIFSWWIRILQLFSVCDYPKLSELLYWIKGPKIWHIVWALYVKMYLLVTICMTLSSCVRDIFSLITSQEH